MEQKFLEERVHLNDYSKHTFLYFCMFHIFFRFLLVFLGKENV
jgi:hypothetical protein